MKKITKARIPVVKGARKPPQEDGWTAKDIREAVEEMHFAESVGEALQTARQARQLTGESLGKRLGIGRSRISQLEHKSYDYDLATLYRVLDALDYDLELTLIPRKGGKAIVVGRG